MSPEVEDRGEAQSGSAQRSPKPPSAGSNPVAPANLLAYHHAFGEPDDTDKETLYDSSIADDISTY